MVAGLVSAMMKGLVGLLLRGSVAASLERNLCRGSVLISVLRVLLDRVMNHASVTIPRRSSSKGLVWISAPNTRLARITVAASVRVTRTWSREFVSTNALSIPRVNLMAAASAMIRTRRSARDLV
jgi:hypothetical protein